MSDWKDIIGPLKQKDYFKNAFAYQKSLRSQGVTVYPPEKDMFNAFVYTNPDNLKVVIIGQDPYHEEGEAMGLSFSVPVGIKIPPSLRNIYKELTLEYPSYVVPNHGNLIPWARQGVLLLNSVLSVTAQNANSHAGRGWEEFTDDVIKELSEKLDGLVFMLWGASAIKKGQVIDSSRHLVLTSVHPSPLSAHRGFFGCGHFVKANEYLEGKGKKTVDWQLPEYLCGSEEL
ncbi:MAG: uracil-DNA glycosylase [Succinivibrio sp.]|nr:uracil-DNA glycosylase [Succinivibrio sp.]